MPIINMVYKKKESINVKEYDFTKSNNGFVYADKTYSSVSYGWDNNGLYSYAYSGDYFGVAWSIPSTVYSQGLPKKIEFDFYATNRGCGGGLSIGADSSYSRTWINWVQHRWDGAEVTSNLQSYTPSDTEYTYTIDLVNKEEYISVEPNVKATISDVDIQAITNAWNGGTMNICSMINRESGTVYSYIRKLRLYY